MTEDEKYQIRLNHDEYTSKLTDRILHEKQLFT
jgi:hypothetical protein